MIFMFSGFFDINFSKGNENKVKITCEENKVEYVSITVSKGMLNIGIEEGVMFSINKPIYLEIKLGNYVDLLSSSGSASIQTHNIFSENIEIDISGSSDVKLITNKEINNLNCSILDSGGVVFDNNIIIDNSTLKVSGSGDIELINADNVKAKVSGSGDITIGKNSNILLENVSGSGDINYK